MNLQTSFGVVIVGGSGVGKTCLAIRIACNTSPPAALPRPAAFPESDLTLFDTTDQHNNIARTIENIPVIFYAWDTIDQCSDRNMERQVFRDALLPVLLDKYLNTF
jgi:GTPase SAR1 family protein